MITREQVADLQPGDVVELTDDRWPVGTVLRGPAYFDDDELRVGHLALATRGGRLYLDRPRTTLTVIARAPRPLYVNHPRTELVPGDVVRDADSDVDTDRRVWLCDPAGDWWTAHEDTVRMAGSPSFDVEFPRRLWLLVDGETGQVVPS